MSMRRENWWRPQRSRRGGVTPPYAQDFLGRRGAPACAPVGLSDCHNAARVVGDAAPYNRRGGFHIRPWNFPAAATSPAAWGHAALRITLWLDVGRGALTPPCLVLALRLPHRPAPLGAGLVLCDRGGCSASLFPPQAAVGSAAEQDSKSSPAVSAPNKKPRSQRLRGFLFGARYRTRTCDLLHVKQMLYQLS